MATNIFGILTTVILIVALFISTKNKDRYEAEIDELITQKGHLAVSQERLALAQKTLAKLNEDNPIAQAKYEDLVSQNEEQRANNTNLESQIQTKTTETERNSERIDQLASRISAFGNVDQLIARLRDLKAELEELNDLDSGNPARKGNLDNLVKVAADIDEDNKTKTRIHDGYVRGESKPGIQTTIRSVYPSWGFVTLSSGGIAGVAGKSQLDVVRDGQVIGKLQVTAVEANSATANIVPGSVSDDDAIVTGDLVVPTVTLETN